MTKALARLSLLLLLLFPLTTYSRYLIDDHIISPKAGEIIEKIGSEVKDKISMNLYVITTTESLGRGVNLYEYIQKYKGNLDKPYIILFFAPNSRRIGVLNSDKRFQEYYDRDDVLDYAIKIIRVPDKNSLQSKYDVGIVQAYSELADEVASKKGVELKNTIKSETNWIVKIITWIVYIGTILVIWAYIFRPILSRLIGNREKSGY